MNDKTTITPISRSRRPIPYLLLWAMPLLLAVGGSIQTMISLQQRNSLAPAAMTGSLCMDEKINFLSQHPENDAQIIVIGSSMGLNNLNSKLIVDSLQPDGRFINLSAWGRSIKQSGDWLNLVLETTSPRLVILPCSLMDFNQQSDTQRHDYDLQEVRRYLQNPNPIWSHTRHFDPIYYLKHAPEIANARKQRSMYATLAFDTYGGVMLEPIDWTNQSRWTLLSGTNRLSSQDQYRALAEIADMLAARNCKLVVLQTPIRISLAAKNQPVIDKHFKQLAQSCAHPNITYFNAHEALRLDDANFADGTHLNQNGATILSKYLVSQLQQDTAQLTRHHKDSPQKQQNQG